MPGRSGLRPSPGDFGQQLFDVGELDLGVESSVAFRRSVSS